MPLSLPDRTVPDGIAADLSACRKTLRGGSRSFFAASLVLPAAIVARASAIYAFCRLADDLIDNGGGIAALEELQARLDAIYVGRPHAISADRALAAVVREVRLPRTAFDALLEGFAWDAAGRRYETLADVHAYAARVAGSVGILMSVAMGRQAPDVLARAADLGVAMQLTNIARDVGEDARAGRLYLPLAWLRDYGIDAEDFLTTPEFSPAIGAVVQRLLNEADRLYARADVGLAHLPVACRPSIRLARKLYAAIGDEVARNGFDSVSRRAIVSPGRKFAAALAALMPVTGVLTAPPLEATAFLVEAAAIRLVREPAPAWWDIRGRSLQVLAIFEKLERADRASRA